MNKKLYYLNMHNNIEKLKVHGIHISGDYLCPLCMNVFNENEVMTILTEEDVPQCSLGGKRIALTCRKCNSTCGSEIDIHLLNAIKSRERKLFLPDNKRKIHVEKDGQRINAELQVEEDKSIKLFINEKNNNPYIWTDFHDKKLLPNELVNIEEIPLKKDERRIGAAIIKNAYLLLFEKTGYSFLYDSYYDDIRKQIFEPEVFHLPERLWTLQNIQIPDGIYLTGDNRYRGFFVVYTLKLKLEYRVCVLIPTPMVPYLAATKELGKIEANCPIRIMRMPELDYLNDDNAISRLRKWCYGWDLKL